MVDFGWPEDRVPRSADVSPVPDTRSAVREDRQTTFRGVTTTTLLLTVDYELFGNGSGSVDRCVVEPTRRLLQVAERHRAPMTLFVEALEFRAIERTARRAAGQPERDLKAVREQLQDAVRRGHDVQLHLHPQWAEARYEGGRWALDLDRWRIADLGPAKVGELVAEGRRFLETLIRPVDASYRPRVFRAGAWCIQPAGAVLAALRANGLRIDSSVAPGLHRADPSNWYDFRGAPAEFAAWAVSDDVLRPADDPGFLEVPIAVGAVDPWRQVKEAVAVRLGRAGHAPPGCDGTYGGRPGGPWERVKGLASRLAAAHRSMLDYCRLPVASMVAIAGEWRERRPIAGAPTPLVAIGHSKSFGSRAAERLDRFLEQARQDLDLSFGTYLPWIDLSVSSGPTLSGEDGRGSRIGGTGDR